MPFGLDDGGGIPTPPSLIHLPTTPQPSAPSASATKPAPSKTKSDDERKVKKDPGIPKDAKLYANGHLLTPDKIATVNEILDVAESKDVAKQLGSHMERALLALVCANIGESGYDKYIIGGTDNKYRGIYQVGASWGNPLNLAHLTRKFLVDGGFYKYGSALDICKAHPDWPVQWIAAGVEGSFVIPAQGAAAVKAYNFEDEARKIIAAYGGVYTNGVPDTSNGDSTVPKEFDFTRPYPVTANPYQNSWDCAQALASEVAWRFFAVSNRLYYFTEPRLAAQTPVIIDRTDDAIAPYIGEWTKTVNNDVSATTMTLNIVCAPFFFHAGEAVQLVGFGGGDNDRWIIAGTRRSPYEDKTELTLAKPQYPHPEPAHDTAVHHNGGVGQVVGSDGYAYPMGAGFTLGRTDMGVDFAGNGTIFAIGNAKVTRVAAQGESTGWPGANGGGSGAMIVYELLDGSHKGKFVYLAENVDPVKGLRVGQTLKPGEAYATARGKYPFLEIGWAANGQGRTLAAATTGYTEGEQTKAGKDFARFLHSLKGTKGTSR
jgi:hypothetical protein